MLFRSGRSVNVLRDYDRVYAIQEEVWHWLALEVLSLNTQLLEQLLPEGQAVSRPKELLASWESGRVPIFDALAFVRDIDAQLDDSLPKRWRVTSDSIAARMATVLGAPPKPARDFLRGSCHIMFSTENDGC